MTKFYYKTLIFSMQGAFKHIYPEAQIEKELNKLGDLGWELVSHAFMPNAVNVVIVLKNTEVNLS